jgi:hypothetical protein
MLIIAACIAAIISTACLIVAVGLLRQIANELAELKKAFFQFRGSVNTIIQNERAAIQASEEASETAIGQDLLSSQNGV